MKEINILLFILLVYILPSFSQNASEGRMLYIQAYKEQDWDQKKKLYTKIKEEYAEHNMSQYKYAMLDFFNHLLEKDLPEAARMSKEIITEKKGSEEEWSKLNSTAQDLIQLNELLEFNKLEEAEKLVSRIVLPSDMTYARKLLLLKTEIKDKVGKTQEAYQQLVVEIAKTPDTSIKKQLDILGTKLGKGPEHIQKDIWRLLEPQAKAATDFELKQYLNDASIKLSELKGKVVLLTYWFPTCGICIQEFPHFENVLRKINSKDVVYLGLNISARQNEQVIPFMKENNYTFIALDDTSPREKGNLENKSLAPVNFLIDKDGRILFSHFQVDAYNEGELEQMIRLLLDNQRS